MPIDFEVEPEFQQKPDWAERFCRDELEPLRLGARLRQRYQGILTQLSFYRGMDCFVKVEDWPLLLDGLRDSAG